MAKDVDKALIAYMEMVDAAFQGAKTSENLDNMTKACMKKLNAFVGLDDVVHPALVKNYQPENYKPKPPQTQ